MKGITGRFVLLIATAAVLPLLIYGAISVTSLQRGTEESGVAKWTLIVIAMSSIWQDFTFK